MADRGGGGPAGSTLAGIALVAAVAVATIAAFALAALVLDRAGAPLVVVPALSGLVCVAAVVVAVRQHRRPR